MARAQEAVGAGAPLEAPPAAPAGDAGDRSAPPAPPPPAQLDEWRKRLYEIDQRSRIVERKLELAEEAAAARKKEAPSLVADESGFGLASADRQYQIKLRGLLQLDGRRFFGDPSLENGDTFVIRRVRPILDGTLLGLVDFRFSPDFGNNAVVVTDAYIDAHPHPWLRLRAGKFKPPVGLERLQADQDLDFIERALDSNLTAQREIGLQLWGDIAGGIVRYEAGVYNGVPDATLLDTDSDHAKTFGGRIFIHPFNGDSGKGLGRLGVGIAASTGNEKGSSALSNGAASNTWLGTFRSAGQNAIYSYLSSTTDPTATVFAFKRHTRINPQLYYYNGPVGLLAEWVREYQELGKGADTGAVNHSAGHITLAFAIGGDVTYEGLKPKRPIDLGSGSFGAVEIAARYNWLDLDDVGFPTLADPARAVTRAQGFGLALVWQLSRNIKVAGEWEQTSFKGGIKGGDRATEKVAIGRFQVAF